MRQLGALASLYFAICHTCFLCHIELVAVSNEVNNALVCDDLGCILHFVVKSGFKYQLMFAFKCIFFKKLAL